MSDLHFNPLASLAAVGDKLDFKATARISVPCIGLQIPATALANVLPYIGQTILMYEPGAPCVSRSKCAYETAMFQALCKPIQADILHSCCKPTQQVCLGQVGQSPDCLHRNSFQELLGQDVTGSAQL